MSWADTENRPVRRRVLTEERAIDADELAMILRAAVRQSPEIRFLAQRKVESVTRHPGLFRIEGSGPEGRWQLDAGQVVNATWENRLAIDETVGLRAEPGWVHRLKYRVIAVCQSVATGAFRDDGAPAPTVMS
jgi:hypothetical protein